MSIRSKLGAIAVSMITLVGAACGDDDDGAVEDDASTSATEQATEDFQLDEPLALAALFVPNTALSPGAFYQEGAELAVEQINAAGGVGGQPIELKSFPFVLPTDATKDRTALLQALDADPVGIVGPPGSAQLLNVAPELAGIDLPVIAGGVAPQTLPSSGVQPLANAFYTRPSNDWWVRASTDWLLQEFDAARVFLSCVDSAYGQEVCPINEDQVETNGQEVCASRFNEVTATDLTEQAIAMGCADVAILQNFPNPATILLQQAVDNGFDRPILTNGLPYLQNANGIPAQLADKMYGVIDCAPNISESARPQEYAEAFMEKYGVEADWTGAQAYDSVFLFVEAVKLAKSTEPSAIIEALKELEYEGACYTYRANVDNIMGTGQGIYQYQGDEIVTIAELDLSAYIDS